MVMESKKLVDTDEFTRVIAQLLWFVMFITVRLATGFPILNELVAVFAVKGLIDSLVNMLEVA